MTQESGNWVDACIKETTSALASITDDDPDRIRLLDQLADFLIKRSNMTGSIDDINNAIAAIKQVLMYPSNDPTDLAFSFRDLGMALDLRFQAKDSRGDLDQGDLDEAIKSYQTAIEHMPVTEPARLGEGDTDRAEILLLLGNALLRRALVGLDMLRGLSESDDETPIQSEPEDETDLNPDEDGTEFEPDDETPIQSEPEDEMDSEPDEYRTTLVDDFNVSLRAAAQPVTRNRS